MMNWKSALAAAGLLSVTYLIGTAFGGANDYAFEPVKAEFKASNVATIAVRLVHKVTGKPIRDAEIVQWRIDMAPEEMHEMTSVIVPLPSPEPGVYAFKAPLTMAGRWVLSIAAKVPGEPETVVGKVTFRATP